MNRLLLRVHESKPFRRARVAAKEAFFYVRGVAVRFLKRMGDEDSSGTTEMNDFGVPAEFLPHQPSLVLTLAITD
jgi:hypothetical protein